MNINGLSSLQSADLYAVDSFRYVYQIVLEEQVGDLGNFLPFSSQPYFENTPISGAAIGSQINIFV